MRLIALAILTFASSFLMADIVGDPVSTPVVQNFTLAWSAPATGSPPTSYSGGWLKDGAALGSFEVASTVLSNSRDIQVINGTVICGRVSAKNPGNQSAMWEECVTVDWLPAVPGVPESVTITRN